MGGACGYRRLSSAEAAVDRSANQGRRPAGSPPIGTPEVTLDPFFRSRVANCRDEDSSKTLAEPGPEIAANSGNIFPLGDYG